MSMIGNFGLCAKSNYDNLVNALRKNQIDLVENGIKEIYDEVEVSALTMENNQCSGEVFVALFAYFETELGINIWENTDLKKLNERWCELTEDYNMVAFSQKEKTEFLSMENSIDCEKVSQYVNDFFQEDYGNAGQVAWGIFLENLRKLDADSILIWHLY